MTPKVSRTQANMIGLNDTTAAGQTVVTAGPGASEAWAVPQAAAVRLQETRLPDGREIFCLQKREVAMMYEEVQEYLDHGLTLKAGDVVFDVGANIGLFTLWIAAQFGKEVDVYAFEPIPAIFAALAQNVQHHQLGNVRLFPLGLSSESRILNFAYFPDAPIISTAFPLGWKDELGVAMLHNPRKMPTLIRWLAILPVFLRRIAIREMFRFLRAEYVNCNVEPLSKIMRDNDVSRIDILKVDVEKSELDVLLGIEQEDWPKIRQVVIEIHDVNGRLDTIEKLLSDAGYRRIVVERSPILTSSNIVSLFATR